MHEHMRGMTENRLPIKTMEWIQTGRRKKLMTLVNVDKRDPDFIQGSWWKFVDRQTTIESNNKFEILVFVTKKCVNIAKPEI